jgi:hypothetical protein
MHEAALVNDMKLDGGGLRRASPSPDGQYVLVSILNSFLSFISEHYNTLDADLAACDAR